MGQVVGHRINVKEQKRSKMRFPAMQIFTTINGLINHQNPQLRHKKNNNNRHASIQSSQTTETPLTSHWVFQV